jgi:hypothetical protein
MSVYDIHVLVELGSLTLGALFGCCLFGFGR